MCKILHGLSGTLNHARVPCEPFTSSPASLLAGIWNRTVDLRLPSSFRHWMQAMVEAARLPLRGLSHRELRLCRAAARQLHAPTSCALCRGWRAQKWHRCTWQPASEQSSGHATTTATIWNSYEDRRGQSRAGQSPVCFSLVEQMNCP